jgi:predicted TIM-barrel fold metal-dependent hydrolase
MNLLQSKNGVDTHFHVFNAGVAIEGARYVPQYSAFLSEWTQQAQSVGISRGVCVQPSFLGTDNRWMVDALRSNPDVLRGIAVVSPNERLETLQVLNDAGVRGIRLNLAGISHEIAQWSHAHQLWQTVVQMGWHLEVHTDQGKLPQVLQQLPSDLPLVIDHMAKPLQAQSNDATLQALKARARVSPIHVKLSGAYRLGDVDSAQLATLLLQELGPHSLLWGSDWPCTNHEQFANFETLMAQARQWIPSEFFEQIMTENPMRLYWNRF